MTDLGIDPDDITPMAVERELLHLSGRLNQANQRILTQAKTAAEADAEYKKARATTNLEFRRTADRKVTVDEVESYVDLATSGAYLQKVSSQAVLTAARDVASNIRSQMSALQTVSANLRYLVERAS